MACIGCGLGLNADGTGRVDIDTQGGLKCTGVAGGTTNAAGRGLAIKADTTREDNSVVLSANGLYVPAVGRFDFYDEILSGTNLVGPNNGTSVTSGENSITLVNDTPIAKVFAWQASVGWSGVAGNTPGVVAHIVVKRGDGDWVTGVAFGHADGSYVVPMTSRIYRTDVPAESSVTVRAKLQVYTGTISAYDLTMTAWGGYGELL